MPAREQVRALDTQTEQTVNTVRRLAFDLQAATIQLQQVLNAPVQPDREGDRR